jgi:hypothetical protein
VLGGWVGLGAIAALVVLTGGRVGAGWGLVLGLTAPLAVTAGALGCVLTRAAVRPFGRVPWALSWLLAGVVIPGLTLGPGLLKGDLQLFFWAALGVHGCALAADGLNRHVLRTMTRARAAGSVPEENVRLFAATVELDYAVRATPGMAILLGLVVGELLGRWAGAALAGGSGFWSAVGGVYGRSAGAGAGGLLAVGLLTWYRVTADGPWPGRGGRPYPWGLAAFGAVVAGVIALFWVMWE